MRIAKHSLVHISFRMDGLRAALIALLALTSQFAVIPPVSAGTVAMPVEAGGGFALPVTSMRELRFRSTVRQQFDYSCGSAAIATLLSEHYEFPVNEQDVFEEMYKRGDQAKIRSEGFSMLDMKRYLEAHGLDADGYVADLEVVRNAGIPAIVLLRENGYNHFVVIKGVRDDRVLLGDPSLGTRAVARASFDAMWGNHMLFVVNNRRDKARFNIEDDWNTAPVAHLEQGLNRSAFDTTLLPRRGTGDF